jgi:membrane peptidoglycan carboxypeptidase
MLPVASEERGRGYPDEPALLTHNGEQHDEGSQRPGGSGPGPGGPGAGPLTGRRRTWWRVRRTCYIVILALVIVPPVAFFIAYQMVSVPTPAAAAAQLDKPVTYLFANGSKLDVHTPPGGYRTLLRPDEIPATMVHAAEAAEDATFQTNSGFDISGIMQAVFKHL